MDVPQAVLQWDRGTLDAACDRAAVVQAGVEAYLGRAAFAPGGQIVVKVSLSRSANAPARVVATVNQQDATGKVWGERIVTAEGDCAALDEPLTLVVALMVDTPTPPEDVEQAPLPERTPAPPANEPVAAAVPPDTSETSEIATAPGLERALVEPAHAAFLGLGVVSMGVLPSAAVGGGLFASFKPRGFLGLGLQAAALAPQQKSLGAGSIGVSLVTLGASLCPLQGVDDATWYSACVGMGAARLRVEGRELLDADSQTEWLGLPQLSARAGWVLRRHLLLGAGLEAAVPLWADRYVYRDREGVSHSALEVSQLVITASVGLGVLLN